MIIIVHLLSYNLKILFYNSNNNFLKVKSHTITHLVCGKPYLIPTPTLGNALMTLFTVFWSGNENITDAREKPITILNNQ